jgi:hypothetical protein
MMIERNGNWLIDGTKERLPYWVMEAEKELENAIHEHLEKG